MYGIVNIPIGSRQPHCFIPAAEQHEVKIRASPPFVPEKQIPNLFGEISHIRSIKRSHFSYMVGGAKSQNKCHSLKRNEEPRPR